MPPELWQNISLVKLGQAVPEAFPRYPIDPIIWLFWSAEHAAEIPIEVNRFAPVQVTELSLIELRAILHQGSL